MINRVAALGVAIAASSLLLAACSVQSRQMAVTPKVLKQIGLPVYPPAQPFFAHDTNQSSRLGEAEMLSASFTTNDDVSRVQAFYVARVPKDAKKIVVPLGFTTTVTYQWFERNKQKQVLLERVRDQTIIVLQSMELSLPKPAQSTTPSAGP